jgi:two-component system, NarL family, sensor histidine kinase DevS
VDRRDLLIETGLALSSELALDAVLDRIVSLAVEVTQARYGALGVLGPDGYIENFVTVGVTPEERAAIGDPPVGHGLLGLLISDARPIRVPNIAEHPRSVGFPPNHPPMSSFMGAPVRSRGRVFGNIYLTEKLDADSFSDEDEHTLVVLASQAGVAIENANLYAEAQRLQEQLQRLAVLEDRERIAKELHDGAIQSLFAVGMGLEGAVSLSADPATAERVEDAVAEIDRVIRDLRNYIFGLRPGILADRQLGQALSQLAKEFEARSSVVTAVEIDDRVASELASSANDIVQIAREALSNVERHAGAQTCRISLRRADGRAELEVDDDGHGFDPTTTRGAGQGLSNMRARAEALGGAASLQSESGEGTTLRVSLPL